MTKIIDLQEYKRKKEMSQYHQPIVPLSSNIVDADYVVLNKNTPVENINPEKVKYISYILLALSLVLLSSFIFVTSILSAIIIAVASLLLMVLSYLSWSIYTYLNMKRTLDNHQGPFLY